VPASAASSSPGAGAWPGRRLGLPETGSRSVARVGRRIIALVIDWAVASLVSALLFDYDGFATLTVFAVVQIILVATIAGSVGHLVMGIRVVPLQGGWIGVWRPVVRTALICVVVPALIWNADQRGLHDTIAGTVLVRV
jgi:uncharacterized RDD family membrane protein YckC